MKKALLVFLSVPGLVFTTALPAHAGTVDQSGHKVCPVGKQVRIYSYASTGFNGKITHYWSAVDDHYGHKVWKPGLPPTDSQTFTLHRNVYWRVVAEGSRPKIMSAGARCMDS